MKRINLQLIAVSVLLAGSSLAHASQLVRETWDDLNLLGSLYPANQAVTNDPSSVGFVATGPWITNPDEHANNTLISIRDFFPEPWYYGLPPNYDGTTVAIVQDNSFQGSGGGGSLWTSGDWMVRQLAPGSEINFNTNGEYWLELHVGMVFDAAYAGDVPASGAGGIGFADGATTNANFVAIGVTGTNLFLGPADSGNPYGTIPATKTDYISQGTLGQAGNPNSLIYNPLNDPYVVAAYGTNINLTNFTGGPYFVNAFGTNRVGQCNGDGIMVLGHLVTHAGGAATMDVKFYNVDDGDAMDLTPSGITWDASYSFSYSGVMSNMLVFENGEFPLYIYDLRVGTTLADVAGMDAEVAVLPGTTVYGGQPITMTNYTGLASVDSNPNLASAPNYGTISYQWQQNGANILDATNSYLNFASASTNDTSVPAGTDTGTYTCISVDESGTWGSVTSAPVNILVTVDNVPPFVGSITPRPDLQTIKIVYSELVNGADVASSYTLSGGVTVSSVTTVSVSSQTVVTLTTSTEPLATKLTLTISGVKDLAGNALTPATSSFWTDMYATGKVNYDAWVDGNGYSASSFYNAYPYPTNTVPQPGFSAVYSNWEAPGVNVIPPNGGATQNSSYGARMYGWFIPPVTTNYVFFVSADDACRLDLSTDADPNNLCVIAVEDMWSGPDNWTNYCSAYPTGPHRGSGANDQNVNGNGGFGGPDGDWDPGPDQNRSDEFITAYQLDQAGAWATTELGFTTDVAIPGSTQLWPTVDGNGNALITLQAGQKYYIMAEHLQEYGGANLSVTYKFASNPGNRLNDPDTGSTSILAGDQIGAIVPFAASVSIANVSGSPVITFTGILSASTTVGGPYTDVAGAVSPYHPASGGTMFFRSHL